MTTDGTVAFHGFRVHTRNTEFSLNESSEAVIITDSESFVDMDLDSYYDQLEACRLQFTPTSCEDDTELSVSRDNIYEDVISYFSNDNFDMKSKLVFQFRGEDAVGD